MSSTYTIPPSSDRVRIVVASTVMLTFITWVRAAAIVLNDLGSSAFYAGSIAEQAFGKAAPWFVLGVMLFSFTVRAMYVESCSMFVRGGVYRVVKEALGGTLAKISVSALMFDYILTGPISGVSAGQYIAGLANELLASANAHGWIPGVLLSMFGGVPHFPIGFTSAGIAVVITVYFWWQNIKGIEESSEKALNIMKVTTVMVVLLLGWSVLTLMKGHYVLPPWPLPNNLHFTALGLGFLHDERLAHMFGVFGILMAFGHSVLAMSGEETLAQVYREIGSPKLKNLKRAALTVAIYSFLFTGVSSLFVVMIVPDSVRMTPALKDNLLGALAMYFVGPQLLKILFRIFVVVVGFLMLAGAVNTAIVGSNGVLNRMSEDGVLTDWFRKPHRKYGTSSRMINLIVGLQLFTIIASRGDVYVLGEAYAFGVIWSFTMKSLSMLVLRYRSKQRREWKVPPNITIAGFEIPIGLLGVTLVLLAVSLVNLITKSVATVSGVIFTAAFFAIFAVSEKSNRRKHVHAAQDMKEHFQLVQRDDVERDSVGIRPGNILVTVRDYNTLGHLKWILDRVETDEQDVVVLTAHLTGFGIGEVKLASEQIFSDYEQTLFTRTVSLAESIGKHISLLVVPARDVWSAIAQTANSLESSVVVSGLSSKMTAQEQAFYLGEAWEAMPDPKRQFLFQVVPPDLRVETFRIGPHTPTMRSDDVYLVHRLWLNMSREPGLDKIHHSDIVSLALTRLAQEYGRDRREILKQLRRSSDHNLLGPAHPMLPGSPEMQEAFEQPREESARREPPTPPMTGPK